MFSYYVVAGFFWTLAAINLKNRPEDSRLTCVLALFLFVVIAGLRFETGYDWLVYEQCFSYTPGIITLLTKWVNIPFGAEHMEPLFYVVISLLKSFNLGLQTLYLLVALFNGFCIYKFVRWTNTSVVFAIAVYFCWVYLPVQMGVMRESIAISFMLLAIMSFFNQKKKSALILFFLGVGFQSSLLIFLPLFFVETFDKILKYSHIMLLLLLVIYIMRVDFIELVFRIGMMIDIELIRGKLDLYQKIGVISEPSVASTSYLFFNAGLFLYFMRKRYWLHSPIEIFLLSSMLLMIFFQTVFWKLPLFWNRIQYFAIISQSVMMAKCWEKATLTQTIILFTTMVVTSFVVFSYFVLTKEALPYIPYQSYVGYLITDNPGTGRLRAEEFQQARIQKLFVNKL